MWYKATFSIVCLWMCLRVTAAAAAPTTTSTHCPKDTVVVYKLVLETFWTEENFPKDYPQFRPRAQWSKLLGETHNGSYHLWQLGVPVSEAVHRLIEHGEAEYLAEEEQDSRVYDQFTSPAIKNGAGISEAIAFVDDIHSKVSAMARLIPSPDWFVGVDSYEMCFKSEWIDAVSIALHPMDAGISAGLTFTAPHWTQEPPEPVSGLTPDSPSHPASSFLYPGLSELPLMAALHIYKIREYSMSEMNNMTEVDASLDTVFTRAPGTPMEAFYPAGVTMNSADEDMPVPARITSNGERLEEDNPSNNAQKSEQLDVSAFESSDDIIRAVANGRKVGSSRHLPRHFRHRLSEAINRSPDAECPVGPWSEWSACSRSCGLGERIRTREVRAPLSLPQPHLPAYCVLEQRHFCGSARLCRTTPYFDW